MNGAGVRQSGGACAYVHAVEEGAEGWEEGAAPRSFPPE